MSIDLIYSDTLSRESGVRHCFTTRRGGVSTGHLSSLNIGKSRGDTPEALRINYMRLSEVLGFKCNMLATSSQVHGDTVRKVTAGGDLFDPSPDCDALITNVPGIALVVYTADCVPLLFYDPVSSCIAAVHAGWRGTANRIVQKTVNRLVAEYGAQPHNLVCSIGPAIGQCCYEVGNDVYSELSSSVSYTSAHSVESNMKWLVDLRGINQNLLTESGILPENISIDQHCTRCNPELFWSHRRDGDKRGLQGAIITLGD